VFRHTALFRFTDESTAEQRQAMIDALQTLPSTIPQLRAYDVSLDAGLVEGNWDASVVADFDDEDAWRSYTADAEHQRILAEVIRPILADRAATQHSFAR
jgi:Stress responsive A/B Barrel Domain